MIEYDDFILCIFLLESKSNLWTKQYDNNWSKYQVIKIGCKHCISSICKLKLRGCGTQFSYILENIVKFNKIGLLIQEDWIFNTYRYLCKYCVKIEFVLVEINFIRSLLLWKDWNFECNTSLFHAFIFHRIMLEELLLLFCVTTYIKYNDNLRLI